jgi:hypothetical protein
MSSIAITGKDGKRILYASMHGEHLRFEFAYSARDETETDYEFIHTVFPVDFAAIPERFGVDPTLEIFAVVREIQDKGRGQELMDALTNKEIVNELFVWRG